MSSTRGSMWSTVVAGSIRPRWSHTIQRGSLNSTPARTLCHLADLSRGSFSAPVSYPSQPLRGVSSGLNLRTPSPGAFLALTAGVVQGRRLECFLIVGIAYKLTMLETVRAYTDLVHKTRGATTIGKKFVFVHFIRC